MIPCARRTWLGLMAIGLIAGLFGCASPPPTSSATTQTWQGRMALHIDGTPVQRWHAGFSLRGSAEQGALDLLSPLGNILAQARWNASGAQVQRGDRIDHYGDTAAMTQDITGAALPMAALFAWLDGRDTALSGWTLTRPNARLIVAQRQDPLPEVNLRIVLNAQP